MRALVRASSICALACACFLGVAACATISPSNTGGPVASDGGGRDGGAAIDGGPSSDGGVVLDGGGLDGGSAQDGGFASGAPDGGAAADAGFVDAGAGDGGPSCARATISPSSVTAGLDCSGTLDGAAIRAAICPGQAIAAGLYDEDLGRDAYADWQREGDGSGQTIMACRDTVLDARALVLDHRLVELTGCEDETDDYFSFEGTPLGGGAPFFVRVNKCSRYPYVTSLPNVRTGLLGQVGPPGLVVDAALAAHVAQYLWFVDRWDRADYSLLGARALVSNNVSVALCEAERTATQIIVRQISITLDRLNRNIERAVTTLGAVPGCP